MGYELRRQLREALGPDITGLQRAVALEIADDAGDKTRESYATLEALARWTGAKSTEVVRNALKRLAAAGWEFRIPLGKGKDGRVLYAVPGTRMTFKVPHFEGVAPAPPSDDKGEQGLPIGGAGARSEGAPAPSEGAGAPPFSSYSSLSSSIPSCEAPADDAIPGQTCLIAAAEEADADKPRRAAKKKPAAKPKKPNPHQLADDLTVAFWEIHKTGSAQSFIAVRGIVRTAIGNGIPRNDLARALDAVAREGRVISGGTLQVALQKVQRPTLRAVSGGWQPFQNPTDHDVYDEDMI
ncbi:hypothetical protein [Embleya sp. NPDC001921]